MGIQKHFVLGYHGRKRKEFIYKFTKYEFLWDMQYPLFNHFWKNLLFLWENTQVFYKITSPTTKMEFACRKAETELKLNC